jgi:soluble lytic murein transglycosylase-like protein
MRIALALLLLAAQPAHKTPAPAVSPSQQEEAMTFAQRMRRWNPLIAKASKRFGVPESWIRAVMQAESGGRLRLAGKPIVSDAGAMGLMQLMPATYAEMRAQYGLKRDPFDPHDNIFAGAAYLRWLRARYGYPTMFAAYNDGPGNLEDTLKSGGLLPRETRLYLADVTASVEGRKGGARGMAELTRPNGEPILVDCTQVTKIRAPLPDEYTDTVQSVITIGKIRQGVREDVAKATMLIRAHGGAI